MKQEENQYGTEKIKISREKTSKLHNFEERGLDLIYVIIKSRIFISAFVMLLGVAVGINIHQVYEDPWITQITESTTVEALTVEIDEIDDSIIRKESRIIELREEITELKVRRELLRDRLLSEIKDNESPFRE